LNAVRADDCAKEIYDLALHSTVPEIRSLAPQIQLLGVFTGESQLEPLLEIAHLIESLSLHREKIAQLSRDDDGVLFGLFYRLHLITETESQLPSAIASAALALALRRVT
jgi:hypothetical protein